MLQNLTMGKRIKQRRKELGITQSKLAETLEISNNHLSTIENDKGNASLELFCKICTELNVTPDFLLIGQLHTDNIPQNVVEMLQRCSEGELEFVQYVVEYILSKHPPHLADRK